MNNKNEVERESIDDDEIGKEEIIKKWDFTMLNVVIE